MYETKISNDRGNTPFSREKAKTATRASNGAGLRPSPTNQSSGKTRSSRRNLNALSFHSLRRTATTLLHEAGVAGAVAQALIGHDSEAIHEHYVNVGREALQKAAAVFPVI
jgi:integrase